VIGNDDGGGKDLEQVRSSGAWHVIPKTVIFQLGHSNNISKNNITLLQAFLFLVRLMPRLRSVRAISGLPSRQTANRHHP